VLGDLVADSVAALAARLGAQAGGTREAGAGH